MGEDQFVIYTDKQVIVYRKRPGSPSFSQVQWRPRERPRCGRSDK